MYLSLLRTYKPGSLSKRSAEQICSSSYRTSRTKFLSHNCKARSEAGQQGPSVPNTASDKTFSSLEILHKAHIYSIKSLDQAGDELEAYCSKISDDESADTCWDALDYLDYKRAEAEEGCTQEILTKGEPGVYCSRLQALESLTHELVGTGQVSNMVDTLATLSRADRRTAGRGEVRLGEAVAFLDEDDMYVMHPHGNTELETTLPDRRDYLREVFNHADRNRDGRLDVEEFRNAMRAIGRELDGHTVALIGEAMDSHGYLDQEQFMEVVEAEYLISQDKLSRMLRSRPASPRWWHED